MLLKIVAFLVSFQLMHAAEEMSPVDVMRSAKFQEVYEQYPPSMDGSPCSEKIPRIIHQIWVGPKQPPEYLLRFQKHIQQMHPGWEYHLWTDASLKGICLPDQDLIDKTSNYGTKADIVRCDILEQFGGVCFDADIDVCASFEDFHKKYDFYAGLEPRERRLATLESVWIGVAVIGVKPHHPIIQEWRRLIRENWTIVEERYSQPKEKVYHHTFYPFTDAVMNKIDEGCNVVLPSAFFYPIDEMHPETMARHFNAGSWKA